MTGQLNFEEIVIGAEIPSMVKQPTTRQLVMWAGASGDFNPIHYDKDFAISKGLPGVIVHGQLACSFLGQMLTDWMGSKGELRKLNCSYKGMNFPGETLNCKGKVTKKYNQDSQNYLECDIWVENAKGEKTVTGRAVVVLPN